MTARDSIWNGKLYAISVDSYPFCMFAFDENMHIKATSAKDLQRGSFLVLVPVVGIKFGQYFEVTSTPIPVGSSL